jgi:hypothetical protein
MQIFLEDLQPKLKEATIETDALLVKITADKIVANEQRLGLWLYAHLLS